jgi:MraZ protein
LDAKGRLSLPADMRKQLSPEDAESFVISRGVDDCLSLYTVSEWSRVMEKLRGLNRFKAKDRKFARMFQKGATKLSLDSSGRLLFPKTLMGWAGIQKDIVLVANVDLWEVWDKKRYDELLASDWDEFEGLAAEVMGDGNDE